MVKYWVLRIKQGKATIDDVPARYREAVAKELETI